MCADLFKEDIMMARYPSHEAVWVNMDAFLKQARLPQALLFSGPAHAHISEFVSQLIGMFLCENTSKPCNHCRACHLYLNGTHPDVYTVHPEEGAAIKIDQIRDLQYQVFQTPKQSKYCFICIDPAEKMNLFAANALLKMLEEPPAHAVFILISEQIGHLLPTILSRCQKYTFPEPCFNTENKSDYLSLGDFYTEDSARGVLFSKSNALIKDLIELIEEKKSPCQVAAAYTGHVLKDVLMLFYLVTAQALKMRLVKEGYQSENEALFLHLSRLLPVRIGFGQIDKINAINAKLNHNINMNPTLVLEDLCLGYLHEDLA